MIQIIDQFAYAAAGVWYVLSESTRWWRECRIRWPNHHDQWRSRMEGGKFSGSKELGLQKRKR